MVMTNDSIWHDAIVWENLNTGRGHATEGAIFKYGAFPKIYFPMCFSITLNADIKLGYGVTKIQNEQWLRNTSIHN